MTEHAWVKEIPAAITVCDPEGVILEMNDRAIKIFEKDGGAELVGQNVLDCHPEPAYSKLEILLASQKPNIYTIEKNGVKKLIYQGPWYQEGQYAGLVELSFEIPNEMPHHVRD
jgi:transcriptional regulator with PAS, ATPase and Fis domain